MASVRKSTRVALIGLSTKPAGYGWLNNFHLPCITGRPNVEIVGVLGSSKRSAEAAISKFSLPDSVKAYDSPEDLARDDNVDLVVVSNPAPAHREVLLPSLRAGKDVFVDWPIDVTYEGASEMAEIAREKRLKTVVGTQGRYALVVARVSEIIASGAIGRVLATSVMGGVSTGGREPERTGVEYSLDGNSGTTIVDIHLAHLLECLAPVVGRMKSVKSTIKTMRPTTNIVDPTTGEIVRKDVEKTAPDQVMVSGESERGMPVNIHLHGGMSPGAARWLIIGDAGEIDISGIMSLPWLNLPVPWTVKVHNAQGTTEQLVRDEEPHGQPAVRRLWDAFFEGKSWPSFEDGIKTHTVVDAVWRSYREGRTIEL